MIFPSNDVASLIRQWRISRDSELLGRILHLSTPLIEVIVSRYDYEHRNDMIQECHAKLIHALEHYDPAIGSNLHAYLTSVFSNTCNTYYNKHVRHLMLSGVSENGSSHDRYEEESILVEVIEHNRKRFPSLPTSIIDEATISIYDMLTSGDGKKQKAIISTIMNHHDMPKGVVLAVYNSTIVFLRIKMEGFAVKCVRKPSEFSILADLKLLLGDEAYRRFCTVFSGMYFRVP
jgi:hypothetical protein